MAAMGPNSFAAVLSPFTRRRLIPAQSRRSGLSMAAQPRYVVSASPVQASGSEGEKELSRFGPGIDHEGDVGVSKSNLNDYFEQAAVMAKSTGDGAGPRWFSPVECGRPRLTGVPVLLYLPGFLKYGACTIQFWIKHPLLVKLVEGVIRSEYNRSPQRPIYLVGESLGGCLALAVAARNPDIDLVLILANPATSFSKTPLQLFSTSQMQLLVSLLESVQPFFSIASALSSSRGDALRGLVEVMEKGLEQTQAPKDLLKGLRSLSLYYSVIADILPINTLMWKMEMLNNACANANSCLHAVKAQTLILTSGRDPLLPSEMEGERLRRLLPKCEIRKFNDNGHLLFLEDGVDLVYTIKVATFYRRGRCHDCAADYLPPTPSEFKRTQDQFWWYDTATSPVMLSTLENGKIARGLAGIPSEGPTLLVGYHMLMAFELVPLLTRIVIEKNIIIRTMAHPMFYRSIDGKLPDLSTYDVFKLLGATPVSGTNLFKLLASKSLVLLYPGGIREAFHRKGEEYQLFWPEQSEFVRMAARFGANIVPFGVVGEDDISQLVVDYDDLVKFPCIKAEIEQLTNEAGRLRSDSSGEVSNQPFHFPGILPKVPGRFYYFFGKPIETEGRWQELKDKKKGQELYLEVKSEVESCLAYLKDKREHDPYRSILSRLLYVSTHGAKSEIPTFEL